MSCTRRQHGGGADGFHGRRLHCAGRAGFAIAASVLFVAAPDARAQCIGSWDGGLGIPGLGGPNGPQVLTVFDDGTGPALYAGGYFTTAGGDSANYIAKWDGAKWSPLGTGIGGAAPAVYALTVFDDGGGSALYAGGKFTTAGGVSANRIAKWNGSSWSALGSGLNDEMASLTVFDDGTGPALYAGGSFTTAGGVSANRIAKWNGSSWSALGSGMNNWVSVLTVFDDGTGPALYVGGNFTTAGGGSANRIAKWNGSNWSALGSGISDVVWALTAFDDGNGPALYAGGFFTTAGGTSVNNIAKWNGSGWSGLGGGTNNEVFILKVFDDGTGPALYAGGYFSTAGGVSANSIAKWNPGAPGTWSALGSGVNIDVDALTVFDDGSGPALYAGGNFTTAGGVNANYIAKWRVRCPVLYVDANATGANNGWSWADAFRNLQDALAAAGTGTDIWVAAGTYKADRGVGITPGDRSATFQLKNGVALYGGFAGTETSLNQRNPSLNATILSGDLNGDDVSVACTQNSPDCDLLGALCVAGFCIIRNNDAENTHNVVTASGVDETAILDGFTIVGGNADHPCCDEASGGGGVSAWSGNPILRNLTLLRNRAAYGGGGIETRNSSGIRIERCVFVSNFAVWDGGAAFLNLGAAVVVDSTFYGNATSDRGGAITNGNGVTTTIANSRFYQNVAQRGAAVGNYGSSPLIAQCLIAGNISNGSGGAILNTLDSSPVIVNSTIAYNAGGNNGGGIRNGTQGVNSPVITNCILWGNSDSGGVDESAQIYTESGTPVVNYSIVQGWTGSLGGTGNFGADPLFFDSDGPDNVIGTVDDDFRLRTGSPAIDAGNNAAVPPGITTDLDGNPRFLEDRLAPNTGAGTPPIVDIGAYEFLRDCNHNGIPDDTDLTLGTSLDCNTNNIPDECDIAGCSGSPACGDCNLNGVPDGCDIALGTSLDVNFDGIPDECIAPAPGTNWSDPIWNLGTPASYPNNLDPNAAANLYVTLPTTVSLILDVTVEINSLQMRDGSTLKVTQSGAGDLSIKSPGNMLIEGNLLVANDRAVSVPGGAVTVGPGGAYMQDPTATGASASLTASGLKLISCPPPCTDMGGLVDLTDTMSATISGDFIIDATQVLNGYCQSDLEGAVAGGYTPPIVRIRKHASIGIGNLIWMGAPNVIINPTVPLTTPVTVSGDFDNRSVRPNCFFCRNGGFLLNGTAPRFFEIAGTDVGPAGSVDGAEFVIGAVEVASGSQVTFRNDFDNNGLGQASCEEALYVEKLKLDAGSTITLNNCRIYYQTLEQDPSATVTLVGCGELLSVVRPASAGADPTAINKGRVISFVPPPTARYEGKKAMRQEGEEPGPVVDAPRSDAIAKSPNTPPVADALGSDGPRGLKSAARTEDAAIAKSPNHQIAKSPNTTPVADPPLSPLGKVGGVAAAGGMSAIRVTLVSLHRVDPPYTGGTSTPFTLFEGQSLYVGPPTQYVESASSGTPFYASQLQCTPEYRDWSTVGLLHVMGEAVVPSSTYKVEILAASCAGHEFGCTGVSAPLQVRTTRWGDVETPYNPPSPDPQPNTSDISALVNKFKSALGAPIKARALLAGGNARGTMGPAEISPDVSFAHISLCVDAFKGLPYPYKPGKCTGDAAKACITDSDCTAQSVTGPCILCP